MRVRRGLAKAAPQPGGFIPKKPIDVVFGSYQHRASLFDRPCQILRTNDVLEHGAVISERLQTFLRTQAGRLKVIFKRFSGNCTSHGFTSSLSYEFDNRAVEIVACTRGRKREIEFWNNGAWSTNQR